MKICLFARALNNGGAEHVAAQLSLLWSRLGHDVVIVTDQTASAIDYPNACCARVVLDPNIVDATSVKRLYDQYRFAVAVFNDRFNCDWYPCVVRTLKLECGCKTVQILHHVFSNWYYHQFCANECTYGHDIAKVVDLICPVEKISALWWQDAGWNALYLPNPVAHKPADAFSYRPSHDIVWSGRVWDEGKRFPLMAQIFQRVKRRVPDARLVVLGTSNKEKERELLSNLPSDVAEAIDFKGYVANTRDVLSQCGLFAATSYIEAAPQVIVEAQAVGLPSVVWDIPVLFEYSSDVGVLRSKDVPDFADKIIGLFSDPVKLVELSRRAYQTSVDRELANTCECRWKDVFAALESGSVPLLLASYNYELMDPIVRRSLMAEIRRGARYFVQNNLPDLRRGRRIRTMFSVRFWFRRVMRKG